MFTNSFYYDALSTPLQNIWEKVYNRNHYIYEQLSLYNAMMAYYSKGTTDIEIRRMVLYYFLSKEFKTGTQTSTLERYKNVLPISSIIPRALNLITTAYDKAPQREFSQSETMNTAFNEIYDKVDFNSIMQEVYKRAVYMDTVAVRPYMHNDQLRLFYLTPDNLIIETSEEDALTIDRLMYSTYKNGSNEIHIWTDEEHRIIKNDSEVSETNKYGVIPFIVLNMDNSTEMYTTGLYELFEAQLHINKFEWLAKMDATYNGLPIKLVTGIDATNLEVAPDKVIQVPHINRDENEPNIRFIQPDPEYDSLTDYGKRLETDALMRLGIPYSILSQDNSQILSGISRIIERQELTERRNKDINKLKHFENKIAQMISLVMNIDGRRNLEADNFGINFEAEDIYMGIDEEFQLDINLLEKGLIPIKEFYLKWNGVRVKEEEAIKSIKERINIYEEIYGKQGEFRELATERETGTNVR